MRLTERRRELIQAVLDGRPIMHKHLGSWCVLPGDDEQKISAIMDKSDEFFKVAATKGEIREEIRWILCPKNGEFDPKKINDQVIGIMTLIEDYLP